VDAGRSVEAGVSVDDFVGCRMGVNAKGLVFDEAF
jgi:hypothetical protein